MKTLILYLSYNGQTEKIANKIANHLKNYCECDKADLKFVQNIKLSCYQLVIVGASVYYGRFPKDLNRFINQRIDWLHSIHSAFFAVNLTARKLNQCSPTTNVYTKKFLQKTPWHPNFCVVFAGALRYPHYSWLNKMMIKIIMMITGGETDCTKDIEYTNWDQVHNFAKILAKLCKNDYSK